MTLTIQDIKTLMSMMQEFGIDKIEFEGLCLTKSKHSTSMQTAAPEVNDATKSLFQAVSDEIPDWIKGKEHMMFAPPFPYPDNPNPKEYK